MDLEQRQLQIDFYKQEFSGLPYDSLITNKYQLAEEISLLSQQSIDYYNTDTYFKYKAIIYLIQNYVEPNEPDEPNEPEENPDRLKIDQIKFDYSNSTISELNELIISYQNLYNLTHNQDVLLYITAFNELIEEQQPEPNSNNNTQVSSKKKLKISFIGVIGIFLLIIFLSN